MCCVLQCIHEKVESHSSQAKQERQYNDGHIVSAVNVACAILEREKDQWSVCVTLCCVLLLLCSLVLDNVAGAARGIAGC